MKALSPRVTDRLAWSEEKRSHAAGAPAHRRQGHDVGEQTKRSPGADGRSQPLPPSRGCCSRARPRARAAWSLLSSSSHRCPHGSPRRIPASLPLPSRHPIAWASSDQSHAETRHQATNPGARLEHGNSAPNGSLAIFNRPAVIGGTGSRTGAKRAASRQSQGFPERQLGLVCCSRWFNPCVRFLGN